MLQRMVHMIVDSLGRSIDEVVHLLSNTSQQEAREHCQNDEWDDWYARVSRRFDEAGRIRTNNPNVLEREGIGFESGCTSSH